MTKYNNTRNAEYEDIFDSINNIAKGKKFTNGRAWAQAAHKNGDLTYYELCNYNNCHDLRIRFSHGNARDIEISETTLNMARGFLSMIKRSKLTGSVNSYKNGSNPRPLGNNDSPRRNGNPSEQYNNRPPQRNGRPSGGGNDRRGAKRYTNLSMYGYEAETLLKQYREREGNGLKLKDLHSLEIALKDELYRRKSSELDMYIIRYRMDKGPALEMSSQKVRRIAKHIITHIPYYEMKYIMSL